ncbi:bumetanide-sensitive sodium-(potassium)-chloride cotransporter [Cimex lectularius]|uniref:Bumetanide-sensitive sodium-(Potassium)-chloride cotransporter n=1 Tax=Cimex lectularius TaxID=79782 RepID=A0A8I6S527_CIMLE|nr:bumetanide-sensitive sodium-(potassium)-chloride cotransporter [Cimex lectularius]
MSGRFDVSKGVSRSPGGGYENPGLTLDGEYRANEGDEGVKGKGPTRERNSFCTLTLEALPRLDSYSNIKGCNKRPSLGELHGEPTFIKTEEEPVKKKKEIKIGEGHGVKLGWIVGVLIPCLLNIWGVMLFLRLSWVVSQSGIGQSLVIIGISATVCIITTLSLSAISTNGEVKGGGIYYIISRSLGPEFGASVGLILAFANAVAASMNTIGFCSSLNSLLKENGLKIIDNAVNDIRIVGIVALFFMVIICAVGMEWETKAQNFLVVIIFAAIANFLIGSLIGPRTDEAQAQGFHGFSLDVMKDNWGSDYRFSENVNQDFFSVFSIFFPSVTGIQAGANISGDLKDPAEAIPKGTLLSLAISMFSYALFVVFAGGAALRDASGNVTDLALGNFPCASDHSCQFGLHNDYSIMQLMSVWGWLIYAGCFAATISTALTNLLSVPRLLQALGIDHIYPGLIFFSKGYGKAGEPYRGYVLTFFISSAFVVIADLNIIATLISNFYLASYALINFCTFHAALIKPLGWRPTFKFYNMWLSLLGFFMCVLIMFLIDWRTSLVTFAVFFVLYVIVVYRKPDANWGSSTQAQTYKTALLTVQKLATSNEHVKNYQPQVLVLSGPPQNRPALIDLANLITKHNSLLVCAEITREKLYYKARIAKIQAGYDWLAVKKIKGFFVVTDGLQMEHAAKAMMQIAGIGKLRPNVLLIGYKSDWQTCKDEDLEMYFNTMHEAFANRMAVAILRIPDGLDYSVQTSPQENQLANQMSALDDLSNSYLDLTSGSFQLNKAAMEASNVLSQSSLTIPGSKPDTERPSLLTEHMNNGNPSDILKIRKKATAKQQILHEFPGGEKLEKNALDNMRIFDKKYKDGYVDVWWLYDDGGLTILLPYILHTRSVFANCKMRIFALANRHHDLKTEEANMARLLAKFRISYESLTMINDIMEEPDKKTISFFHDLIAGFRTRDNGFKVTDEDLVTLSEKTDRQLRLRELLLKHSRESTLVVMSLPMPRKGLVSAPIYMAWLEALTKDLPPFLLIRGNQAPVITFYS